MVSCRSQRIGLLMDNEEIFISGIQYDSCVNGVGFRDVIYISGCWHKCMKYCHNKDTHNPNFGKKYIIKDLIKEILNKSSNEITISGGDGLTFQINKTFNLVKELKVNHCKNIWLYTGYKFEELLEDQNPIRREILNYIDVLVDGNFNPKYKYENSIFVGDSSQRIIDVTKSLKYGKVILFEIQHLTNLK